MIEIHLGHHGVNFILAVDLPFRTDPGKTTIHPDPEAGEFTADMIFLAHVGEVEVPQIVMLIKGQQESTVTDGNITGHQITFPCWGLFYLQMSSCLKITTKHDNHAWSSSYL